MDNNSNFILVKHIVHLFYTQKYDYGYFRPIFVIKTFLNLKCIYFRLFIDY